MTPFYLRFDDRAEALAVLSATLGYASTADVAGGVETTPAGWHGGTRYELCFLADRSVSCGSGGDHVNLAWRGIAQDAPDFGGHVMMPVTPSCIFAD